MDEIEKAFPNLVVEGYARTSDPTPRYNCIAWAAGDSQRWWCPNKPLGYWPPGVRREVTIGALISAYTTVGFSKCETPDIEDGYDKLAIYADDAGRPTHAARQLPDGSWSSKLGEREDIKHTINGVAGDAYGTVVAFMRRAKAKPPTKNQKKASRRVQRRK